MQEPTCRVELTVSPDIRDRLERWRGRQFPVASRAEAIRRLLLAALEAGDVPATGASAAPVPAAGPGDVPPLPLPRSGDEQLNVKISAGTYDLVDWAAKARGTSKRAVVDQILRDGVLRLARELGAAPPG